MTPDLPRPLYEDGWPDTMHAALYWIRKRRKLKLSTETEEDLVALIMFLNPGGDDVAIESEEVALITPGKKTGESTVHFKGWDLAQDVQGTVQTTVETLQGG